MTGSPPRQTPGKLASGAGHDPLRRVEYHRPHALQVILNRRFSRPVAISAIIPLVMTAIVGPSYVKRVKKP